MNFGSNVSFLQPVARVSSFVGETKGKKAFVDLLIVFIVVINVVSSALLSVGCTDWTIS